MCEIIEYSINTAADGLENMDHDMVCVAQAGQLLKTGCMEYETAAYGVAYRKNRETYYVISSRESSMLEFVKEANLENVRYTPMQYYFKRYDLLDETKEMLNKKFRIEFAEYLSDAYPDLYFDAMDDLTGTPCNNAAYPLLKKMTVVLENSFDDNQLNIFESLLDLLLQSRLLSKEGYYIFLTWLQEEYAKASTEPIVSSAYQRAYTGFAYEKPDGTIGYFADAVYYLALEKRNKYIEKGYCVTPMLTKQYYADSFENLYETRKAFLELLKIYLDDNYMAIMKQFHALSSNIDAEKYHIYEKQLEKTGKEKAIAAFRYYGHLWNVI